MRKIRLLGMAFIAALVWGAVTATSAFAVLEFKQTGMGFLVGSAMGSQVFGTEEGSVECTELKIVKVAASEAELNPEWQLSVVEWGKCTAFGFISIKNIEAMLDFNVTGFLRVENNFSVEVPLTGCKVTVFGFPKNQKLKTVSYTNVGAKVEIKASLTGVEYEANSSCTKPGTFTTGTFTGNSLIELPGFTVSA